VTHKYQSPFDLNVGNMTVEEVKERLRADGFPVDSWVSNEGRVKDGDKTRLPTFTKCAELLMQIRDVIEEQKRHDLREMDDLNYQLRRLQRGGGR
jgi:hypothetical protein